MTPLPLRLPPGVDLREALERTALPEGAGGAFVLSGIGSLIDPRLRFAAASAETLLAGAFEIIMLSGSIAAQGAHLHIVVSDERGAVFGGHLAYGSRVRTTAEVLLVGLSAWRLSRAPDPDTGFNELVVVPR